MKGRARFAAVIAALCAAIVASAVEWPTDERSVPLTFGSGSGGRFLNGIVIGSKDGIVHAADSGELFFYLDRPELDSGFPSTIRAFAALESADGVTTLYGSLEPGSVSSYLSKVDSGDILGRVDSGSDGLYFSVFDRPRHRRVNPFIFMQPPKDERQPTIRSVALAQGQKMWPLGETRSVRQGTYELVAAIEDPDEKRPTGAMRAPHRVRVFLDGSERLNQVYEHSEGKDGRVEFFGSGVTADEFWKYDGRVSLGNYLLNRGKASILIVVKDHAGNEREAGFTVLVE